LVLVLTIRIAFDRAVLYSDYTGVMVGRIWKGHPAIESFNSTQFDMITRGLIKVCVMVGVVAAALFVLPSTAGAATGFVADDKLSGDVDADSPAMAFAPNGYAVAVWVEKKQDEEAVRVSVRPPAGEWSDPQQLESSSGAVSVLSGAVNDRGEAVVAWQKAAPMTVGHVVVATRSGHSSFGAVETLSNGVISQVVSPAVGIDATGEVTLLTYSAPAVEARTFSIGASLLAARTEILAPNCILAQPQLAVAPSGDAVTGFHCTGAVFALRRNGTWTTSPEVMDINRGFCPTPSPGTYYNPLKVAIDAQGHAAGVMEREALTVFCDPENSSVEYSYTLVVPVNGVMTPVPGPPVTTGHADLHTTEILAPDVSIAGNDLAVSWGAKTVGSSNTSAYQPKVRFFTADGEPVGTGQTIGSTPSPSFIRPDLTMSLDGRALIAWAQSEGGQTFAVASTRLPGDDRFGVPVPVSVGSQPVDFVSAAISDPGNGAVMFRQGMEGGQEIHVRGYDATPPTFDGIVLPVLVSAGVPAAFSATATDFWGPLSVIWRFGDGGVASEMSPSHVFAAQGEYTVIATIADALGNTVSQSGRVSVGPPLPSPPPLAPVLSKVSLTHSIFRVGAKPTPFVAARRKRRPVGTEFRYRLDRVANVTINLDRAIPGYWSGTKCLAAVRQRQRRKHCIHYREVGELERMGKAGLNRVRFSGRLGSRRLPVGRYRAIITAKTGGVYSSPARLSFRIVR
jgi:chitodextrinase